LVAGSAFFFWQSRQYYRPSVEALRWYDDGVAALREGNNVKATRALQQAISQDNHFVMAHARLAEAWANLDFDGNAQREFLLASPGGRHLEPLDRMYLDAIHATVIKDSPAEIAIYRKILNRLPPAQKYSGYVDLGVAYERAEDPNHALENYIKAASLNGDNPAPFMHIAVLQSRQHHDPEADQAFRHAQALLTVEMNQEGLAELDYARGYAAVSGRNSADAIQFLQRSLDEATMIPSVQLQIRVLTQLSSVTSRTDPRLAAKYAEQAIRLARENQLDAWAADGLVRLGDAQIHEGDLQQAEGSLQEALQLAHQTQQLRVEALANLALANLMNQKHLPDQVIGPAQAALDYFTKNGYFSLAARASLLLIRTERDKGQYQLALSSGNASLDVATKSGVRELKRQAEELIGSVFFAMEQYPDALIRFQDAKASSDTASSSEYEAINAADALWRLGRYYESEEMLQFVPANDAIARLVDLVRIQSLLSSRKYGETLRLAEQTLNYSTIAADDRLEMDADKIIAESRLGMKKQALTDWEAWKVAEQTGNSMKEERRSLVTAEIALANGLWQQAHDESVKAAEHFALSGQMDSELHSLCFVALAAKELHNRAEYEIYSAKVVDIISKIQQTWSPKVSQTYLSRPDLQMLMREIPIAVRSNRR
jgi:tetratricopeptide (TPR) repeat protein